MRIGNSVGVTLDRKLLREVGLDGVTWIAIELDKKRKSIIIRKRKDAEW